MILTLDNIQLEDKRKFSKLGREFFFYNPEQSFDPLKESQKNHKLFSLNLPENLSENFLSKENLTLYLLDYFKFSRNRQNIFTISKDVIRETLFKWFLAKSDLEKESSFLSLLKFSRPNNLSFYDELMLCSFLVREMSAVKDKTIIETKLDYLSGLSENEKNVQFDFFLNMVKIFFHLEFEEWETALYSVNDIEHLYEFSPNASFYKSLLMLKSGDIALAESSIEQVLEYDTKRLSYAIENYSAKAFDLFLANSFIQNIFSWNEGPLFSEKITTLNLTISRNLELIKDITNSLKTLEKDIYNEYKGLEITNKLAFYNALLIRYGNSKSHLFVNSLTHLDNKLKAVIGEVIQNIENRFSEMIDNLLMRYEERIRYNKELLRTLEDNNTELLKKEEIRNQKLLKEYETRINNEIKYYESKLEKSEKESSLASTGSLKNSLVYTGLLSLFVLLSGGFAEYSTGYLNEIANITSIISIVIMGGLKWGAITFIIGLVISVFLLISNIHSKYTFKNSLIQQISNLSTEKEKGISTIKDQFEERKKHLNNKYEISKKRLLDEIEVFNKTKEEERKLLSEKYSADKNDLLEPLQTLFE